jgi:hypothetical protein
VPPKISGIRCWVYSFPGQYDKVVDKLRELTGGRFTEFDPDTLEPRIYWNSFDRATEFSTGAVTVNHLIYDHSYTVLENCKVRNLESFKLIDDKTAKKTRGWVTVVKNEPNPEVWHGDEHPHFQAAIGWSQVQTGNGWKTEERLPLPQQAGWPDFFGHKPFAVWDGGPGNVRYWNYTFRANWDDVVRATTKDLESRGYHKDGKSTPTGITFRRGMLQIISITLDDDSYILYRDTRGASRRPHGFSSPGWLFVTRAEPVSGSNLRFAQRSDKEHAKLTPKQ